MSFEFKAVILLVSFLDIIKLFVSVNDEPTDKP